MQLEIFDTEFEKVASKAAEERELCIEVPTLYDGVIQLFDILGQHSKDSGFIGYKEDFDPIASNFNAVGVNMCRAIVRYVREIDTHSQK